MSEKRDQPCRLAAPCRPRPWCPALRRVLVACTREGAAGQVTVGAVLFVVIEREVVDVIS